MNIVRSTAVAALVVFVTLSSFGTFAFGTDCDAPAWLKPGIYAKYLFTVTRGDVLVERNIVSVSIDNIDESGIVKGRYKSMGTSNFTVNFSYNACRELPSVFSFYITPSQLKNLSNFLSPKIIRLQVGTFSAYRWKYTLRNQVDEYNVVKWIESSSGLVLGEIALARKSVTGGKAIQLTRYMYTLIDTNIIKLERRFSEKNESSLREIIEALEGNETHTRIPSRMTEAADNYLVIDAFAILLAVIGGIILYLRIRSKSKRTRKRRRK